ncbi:hypothetical protein GQ457_12G013320 [Hibiscus cannabinus]
MLSYHLQRMASELVYSMENLQFTEAETESVVLETPCEAGDSELWLVGSVISSKAVDGDSICRIFRSVWKSKNITEILELRPNFFLIKPVDAAAKDMILKRRPWVVDEDLFSIEAYNPEWRAVDFDFMNMVIWVRVYQLPLRAMNGTMGLQLGGTIGRAIGVDHRGKKLSPCPLKYEQLPRFCYHCGLLGHDLAACLAKPPDLDIRKLQYGSWLRVSTQKPAAGSRRRQGIEYFDRKGESAETIKVAAGQNSVRVEAAGVNEAEGSTDNSVAGAAAEAVDPLNAGTGPSTTASQVPLAAGNVVNPCSPAESVQFAPSGAKDATAVPKAPTPVDEANMFVPEVAKVSNAAAAEAVATKVSNATEAAKVPNEADLRDAAHVDSVLQTSAGTHSAQSEGALPPDGSSPMKPAIFSQDTLESSCKVTEGPTRTTKRTIQGKYEPKLSDGGCRATPSSTMKILCWNCRGLGSPATVQSLGSFIAQHDPVLVFLCETRLKQSSSSRIQHAFNMDGCFVVDYGNGCTGLMILWNRKIKVTLLSYSSIHIDVNVATDSGSFHFSGLHGHCVDKNKHLTWSTIDHLRSSSALPWLVGGDLNEILCHSEKEGGRRKLPGFLDTFRDCLDRNHLIDCKPISGWFTWLYTNSVSGMVIQECLDRYLATTEWFTLFPDYRVSSFFIAKSDHCFLLMDTTREVSVKGGSRDYFRFDSCWSKEEDCIERVRSSWLHSSGSTVSRLQAIGDSLRSWQADRRVSSTKRMSDLQSFLNSCMQGTITDEAKVAFLEAKREHKSLLDKDEAYWAQRARVTWLTHGDRNTA